MACARGAPVCSAASTSRRGRGAGGAGRRGRAAPRAAAESANQESRYGACWPERCVVPEVEKRLGEDGYKKTISLLGSTGSIGTQTLDIVAEHPDKFEVRAEADAPGGAQPPPPLALRREGHRERRLTQPRWWDRVRGLGGVGWGATAGGTKLATTAEGSGLDVGSTRWQSRGAVLGGRVCVGMGRMRRPRPVASASAGPREACVLAV